MTSSARIESIRRMLQEEPDDNFLNYGLALELIKNNQTEEATLILERLLKRDENYLGCYYQLGKVYESLGRKTDAVTIYTRGMSIARSQKNTKTQNELREALQQLEDNY